mmetsp:Transcript_17483/g.36604  ORF Transcript_17483/g.36604 Transcript_17483/m.36604 type:complete len:487 (+) Transcript_17483:376-1836(+)
MLHHGAESGHVPLQVADRVALVTRGLLVHDGLLQVRHVGRHPCGVAHSDLLRDHRLGTVVLRRALRVEVSKEEHVVPLVLVNLVELLELELRIDLLVVRVGDARNKRGRAVVVHLRSLLLTQSAEGINDDTRHDVEENNAHDEEEHETEHNTIGVREAVVEGGGIEGSVHDVAGTKTLVEGLEEAEHEVRASVDHTRVGHADALNLHLRVVVGCADARIGAVVEHDVGEHLVVPRHVVELAEKVEAVHREDERDEDHEHKHLDEVVDRKDHGLDHSLEALGEGEDVEEDQRSEVEAVGAEGREREEHDLAQRRLLRERVDGDARVARKAVAALVPRLAQGGNEHRAPDAAEEAPVRLDGKVALSLSLIVTVVVVVVPVLHVEDEAHAHVEEERDRERAKRRALRRGSAELGERAEEGLVPRRRENVEGRAEVPRTVDRLALELDQVVLKVGLVGLVDQEGAADHEVHKREGVHDDHRELQSVHQVV